MSLHWACVLALSCCAFSSGAEEAKGDEAKEQGSVQADPKEGKKSTPRRWYLRLEGLNIYPDLEDEKLLEGPANGAFRLLTFGHHDLRTFSEQRDNAGLWAPQTGVGRDIGEHVSVFAQAGYSTGILRTDQRNPTRLLLPLRSSLEMRRGGTYVVIGADCYPYGFPAQRRYHGLVDRLSETKLLAGVRFSYNRTVFDGNLNLGSPPLSRLLHVRMDKAWDIFNFYPVLGAEVPVTQNTTVSFSATYNYPSQQKENLRGPGMSISVKRYFR